MPDPIALVIGGLVAAITGMLSGAGIQLVSHRLQMERDALAYEHQVEREHIAYLRAQHDANRARLVELYMRIGRGAEAFRSVAFGHLFSLLNRPNFEPDYAREVAARLDADIREAKETMDEARIAVEIEGVSKDVRAAFERLFDISSESIRWFGEVTAGLVEASRDVPAGIADRLDEARGRLYAAMRAHIQEIDDEAVSIQAVRAIKAKDE